MSTPFGQAIANDHRTIYNIRDQYVAHASQPRKQQELVLQLLWEIARHLTTEDILVHPWYIKAVGMAMGKSLSAFDTTEHQAIKDNILLLLNMNKNPGDLEFDNGIEKIIGDLHRHNDSEEESDVPTLESSMTPEQAAVLAQGLEKGKLFFIPERFRAGDGTMITADTLKIALTMQEDRLRADFLNFVGLATDPIYKLSV